MVRRCFPVAKIAGSSPVLVVFSSFWTFLRTVILVYKTRMKGFAT